MNKKVESEKIVKVTDDRWDKLLLKKTKVDQEVGFDFKISPLKWVGVVFAVSSVFLPFLLSIIFQIVFSKQEFENLNLSFVIFVINIVLSLMGMIYIIKVMQWEKFLQSAAIGFYLFLFLPNIFVLFGAIFIQKFDKQTQNLFLTGLQIIAHLVAIILIFRFAPSLRLRFKRTIKENFGLIMAVIFVALLIFFFQNYLFAKLDELINGKGISKNQESIESTKNTTPGMIMMFFLTIIFAPFIEELACRQGIFTLSGNKWLGFFTSILYFAGMHVQSSGDWNRILLYIGGSLTLTLVFLYVRGNVTYTIFLHMLINTIAFIISFIAK